VKLSPLCDTAGGLALGGGLA